MSAMHAGVMTTSTEMMYAQHVTLTCSLLCFRNFVWVCGVNA